MSRPNFQDPRVDCDSLLRHHPHLRSLRQPRKLPQVPGHDSKTG
jgi:hypothetical protein